MKADFNSTKKILQLLKFWWLITILAMIGALIGFLLSMLNKPIYSSAATLTVSLDYTRTGALSEADQDRAYQLVGEILHSDPVRDAVIAAAARSSVEVTQVHFDQNFIVERRNTDFDLVVEAQNPQQSAVLANVWADEALAYFHSIIHQSQTNLALTEIIDQIEHCFSLLNELGSQAATCPPREEIIEERYFDRIEASISQTGEESLGVLPAFTLLLSQRASEPDQPRIFNRNWMVAGGSMIGLSLGIVLIEAGTLIKWKKVRGKV